MTIHELASELEREPDSVRKALATMPDVYIDRYVQPATSSGRLVKYTAVWCVVVPPENCPHPEKPT